MATQIDSNDWNAEDNMWDIPAGGGGCVTIPVPTDVLTHVMSTTFPTLFTGAITAGHGVPYRVRPGSFFATDTDAHDAFMNAIQTAVSNNAPSVMSVLPGTLSYPLNIASYNNTVLGEQYPGVSVSIRFSYGYRPDPTALYTFDIELTIMAGYIEYAGVATPVYYAPAIGTLVDTET